MKKISIFLIGLFLTAGTFLYAADATVTFVSGKVEVQRDGKWVPLKKGDTLSKSDVVNTGFQSEAKIKIYDSVMYLGPVTRIALEELSTTGKQDNVSVYLKTGAARSQVKHVDDKRVKYQVRTAVAVASCRGTDWIIDDSNKVIGIEGAVSVRAYNPAPVVAAGDKKANSSKKSKETEAEEKSDTKSEEKADSDSADKEEAADNEAADEKSSDDYADGDNDAAVAEADDIDNDLEDDGGILVTANQSVSVSDTGNVSMPVSSVEDNAIKVISTVNTESVKVAVAEAAGSSVTDKKDDDELLTKTLVEGSNGTGTVLIKIIFE